MYRVGYLIVHLVYMLPIYILSLMFLVRTNNSLDIHRRDQSAVHLFDEVELLGHVGPIEKYSVLAIGGKSRSTRDIRISFLNTKRSN